jgi:hypothetical protein
MMQNGFRRLALAQGLLPERPSARETSEWVEIPLVALEAATDGSNAPVGAWGDQRDSRSGTVA